MRLLLDSHVLLWLMDESERLGKRARSVILGGGAESFVSVASIWEIEIKRASGKLDVPDRLLEILEPFAIALLPIEARHAVAAARLPPHHADPFDRVLCAQAMIENLTLVTADQRLALYDVDILPAV